MKENCTNTYIYSKIMSTKGGGQCLTIVIYFSALYTFLSRYLHVNKIGNRK